MTSKPLRDYQELGIQLIGEEIRKGRKAVCFNMGTGLGKTTTIAALLHRHFAKVPTARVLWLAHREELVGQAYDELTDVYGLSCGVIMSVPTRPVNPHRPVQVASIQTLLARKQTLDGITICVHDEAHHGPSELWSTVPLLYKQRGAIVIGPTATPVRSDGLGLGNIYDSLVCPITVKRAIARGFLTPFELHRPSRALKSGQIAQKPVDAYLEHASGRKAIVFSGMVTGKMDAGTRRQTIDAYKAGKLRVLVNVGVLTEGFDDPPTSCVILARAIGSLGLYLQICGRALRLSRQTGKTDTIILDLHGSSYTHGPPDEEHEWELEGEAVKKRKAKLLDVRFCAICQALLEEDVTVCPECGTPRPEPVVPEVVGTKLVKYAQKRRESPEARTNYLVKLILEAQQNSYKLGWAYNKYKVVYGDYPPNEIKAAASKILKAQPAA
jgi:DNA repair protein RadD